MESEARVRRVVVAAMVAGFAVAACGGTPAPAVVGVVDTQLAHGPGGANFAVAVDGQPVEVGDAVRTDDTGFGEVRYADGSVVRLDVDTTITVLDLSLPSGDLDVRVRMDTPGRSWHRVQDGVQGYVVETAVGTAAVRGTAFVVTCLADDTCTVDVLEGSVEVTGATAGRAVVEAPGTVAILADGTLGDRAPLRLVDAIDSPWAGRNVDRDGEQGFGRVGGDELAGADDVDGFWSGNWGRMVIRNDGGDIRAAFDHDQGTISGRLVGGVIFGWWCEAPTRQPPSDAGPAQFRFVRGDDGTFTLDGRWKYANEAADAPWREDWDLGPDQGEAPAELLARFAEPEAFCPTP